MPHTSRPARRVLARLVPLALAALFLGVGLSSCAYYNTFYIAKKYYYRSTGGAPYRVDRGDNPDLSNLNKSIDYSKKLLANYPKSKWVDDAYLLWARAFLAKDDPLQTVTMLQDFSTRFPQSPLKNDATFYRAVALRQARRYAEAATEFDAYLGSGPKGELVPYAHLELSRTLRALDRPAEAAQAAGIVVQKWPKSPLAVTARIGRAEAALAQGDFEVARSDFRFLGAHSRTDDERLDYLLRESECLEAARKYDEAQSLLRAALGHERPPLRPDTTGGKPLVIPQTPGYDRYGRLLTRMGTVQLMSGDPTSALASYRRVVQDYPRTPVGAEAQYRVGYALEIGADDFDAARVEYAKVREQNPSSPFVAQATQRQTTLDQLARFRSAGADSADARAQVGFLLAEQYLFQLNKPDRALVEYAKVSSQNVGSPWAGKALNAQGWVLKNKLNRPAAAESLWWKVVREYPATESQLAARDYLEGMGKQVSADLIKLPPEPAPAPAGASPAGTGSDLFRPLTPPPPTTPGLRPGGIAGDSAARAALAKSILGGPTTPVPPVSRGRLVDSSFAGVPGPDSLASTRRPGTPPPGSVGTGGGTSLQVPIMPSGIPSEHPSSGVAPIAGDSTKPAHTSPVAIPSRSASRPDTLSEYARQPQPGSAALLPGVAPARAATLVPDTTGQASLPRPDVSPVRAGITFPAGPPRSFGLPGRGSTPPPRENPVIGAPSAAPSPGAPGAAGRDTLRAAPRAVPPDSLRKRQGFQPKGSRYQ